MSLHAAGLSLLSTVPSATGNTSAIWDNLCAEAVAARTKDPALQRAMNSAVLYHVSFAQALGHRIAQKLANHDIDVDELLSVVSQALLSDPGILQSAAADLLAVKERDPSNQEILTPFLYFKGFLALQGHRIAHWLWTHDRLHLARHMQSRISEVFGVDIHPAARMGKGIILDHGSVVVSPVAPFTSVVGIPAKPVGRPHTSLPGVMMDQSLDEPDYVI